MTGVLFSCNEWRLNTRTVIFIEKYAELRKRLVYFMVNTTIHQEISSIDY
jgi:hypothetical protein